MWEDIFRHLNHLPVHLLRDSRVARIEHDIDQVCLTPNPEHVDSPCKRARTVSSCTCYGKRRQCLPLILCKRVASNWLMLTVDRKDESLIQLSEANLTPVLHNSTRFYSYCTFSSKKGKKNFTNLRWHGQTDTTTYKLNQLAYTVLHVWSSPLCSKERLTTITRHLMIWCLTNPGYQWLFYKQRRWKLSCPFPQKF